MGQADLPAPSLWHCYNYSYSCGCNSLWTHYSQEADKSKNQRFIIWLWYVEDSRLPAGHMPGGNQKPEIRDKHTLHWAPASTQMKWYHLQQGKKAVGLLGNFQSAGQQRRSCCLQREGDTTLTPRAQRKEDHYQCGAPTLGQRCARHLTCVGEVLLNLI